MKCLMSAINKVMHSGSDVVNTIENDMEDIHDVVPGRVNQERAVAVDTDGKAVGDDDVISNKRKETQPSLLLTSEGPNCNPLNALVIENAKVENEPGYEDMSESDEFDEMFVPVQGENSASKSEQIQHLDQRTTQGVEDQKVSFHGTKGDYYDEYNHRIYQDRIKHQDQ
eukprot:954792_1